MKALSLPIPELSILARRRSVRILVPQSTPLQAEKKKAKLQSSDNGNSQLITVTADDRVNEFPSMAIWKLAKESCSVSLVGRTLL